MCPYIINCPDPTSSLHRAFPPCFPTPMSLTGAEVFEGLPSEQVSPVTLPVVAVG